MAASSNYKTYARQTRMLTEEAGFAGGMLWTDNNIDATHLKNIVNFDYDDTTTFLKTRDPFSVEAVLSSEDNTALGLDPAKGCDFIGAYEVCPHLVTESGQTLLRESGTLYLFGDTQTKRCPINKLQAFYKDESGNLFYVGTPEEDTTSDDPTDNPIYRPTVRPHVPGKPSRPWISKTNTTSATALEDSFESGVGDIGDISAIIEAFKDMQYNNCTLTGQYGIKPFLYDNVFYCTDDIPGHPLVAFRLRLYLTKPTTNIKTIKQLPVSYDDLNKRSYTLEFQLRVNKEDEDSYSDWRSIEESINDVTLLNSLVMGFNGAREEDTYTFKSTVATETGKESFQGFYYTSENNDGVILNPILGEPVNINVVLNNISSRYTQSENNNTSVSEAGTLAMFKQVAGDETDINSIWEYIGRYSVPPPAVSDKEINALKIPYTFTQEKTVLAFTWLPPGFLGTVTPTVYERSALAVHAPLVVTAAKQTGSNKLRTYALSTATASCLWNSRAAVWGVNGAKHNLFLSDVDNFYYFPIPNNVITFDTEVINCIPYLGDLLVFTANKVCKVSVDDSGQFTQVVIQNDMPTNKEDAAQLCAIKNMVLFKSGPYYYMVVPKSQSLVGELTIAPIYKNISSLLSDKETYVIKTLSMLYPNVKFDKDNNDISIVPADTPVYVEQDTIRILYDVSLSVDIVEDGKIIPDQQRKYKLFLNYNTNLRAWTVYIEDTTTYTLAPAVITVPRNIQYMRTKDGLDRKLVYLTTGSENTIHLPYKCLIDTGYRTLSNSIKKRFREVQIKLYSELEETTVFGSAFYLDGVTRKCYNKLEEVLFNNQFESSDVNRTITLAPVFEPNAFLLEDTVAIDDNGQLVSNNKQLGSDKIELSDWTLDLSHFKRSAPTTLRVPVSGKGYAPRFVLLSSDAPIYINQINWVYRTLYGR